MPRDLCRVPTQAEARTVYAAAWAAFVLTPETNYASRKMFAWTQDFVQEHTAQRPAMFREWADAALPGFRTFWNTWGETAAAVLRERGVKNNG